MVPDLTLLEQQVPVPKAPRPIVIIGAGGIVRDAHLPVYRRLGFEVAGLFDVDRAAAVKTAERFGVSTVFSSLSEAVGHPGVVFDLAVPAPEVLGIVEQLPTGAGVLIQKPLGRDLAEARCIVEVCEKKQLTAAMNFQLRFSPNVLALKDAIDRGWLGEITDVEVRVNVHTPWELWSFMRGLTRHELLYHSIHYLDSIRWLVGDPKGSWCRALRHPLLPDYGDTRSTIILDYGDRCRCSLMQNHAHDFGDRHAASVLRVEGTRAAVVAQMGVNLDYPRGRPDTFEFCQRGSGDWIALPLRGSWFVEAFEGPMSELQRVIVGECPALRSPVSDALSTMALVEASYESSALPSQPIAES